MKHLLKPLFAAAMLMCTATVALANDRPRIVAVNAPLQYIAQRLLGDAAEVVFPVPQDVDPSFWRPSIADISMIQSSDLILLNGAGFATWVDRVSLPRSKLVNTSAAIEDQFIVTESITHSHGEGDEHSHEGLASYTWLDPSLATAQAEAVAAAIIAKELAPADEVESALTALTADFAALDAAAQSQLAAFQDTPIIATHPRYHYFANRYDLSIASLDWEAGAAPTDAQAAELAALVAETGAGILIWEAEPPAAGFDAAAELGLQNVVFDPLASSSGERGFIEAFAEVLTDMAQIDLR